MKTKTNLVLCAAIGAVVASVFMGCQKEELNQPFANVGSGQSYRHDVQQKMYNISGDRVVSIIQLFKNDADNRLDPDDSVVVDSAIWLVETVLNYDMDRVDNDNYDFEIITTAFDAPASEATFRMSSDDVDNVYAVLGDAIRTHIDEEHLVKVIDIEAYFVSPNVIHFTAQAAVAAISLKHPCSPIPINGSEYWSSYSAMNSISPSLLTCGTNATMDAVPLIQQKLNCMAEVVACSNGGVGAYMNISTDFISSGGNTAFNSYPNELFSNTMYNPCTWCNPPATVNRTISDVQMNTYIANIKSYITNSVLPPNYTKITCSLGVLPLTGGPSMCGPHKSWGWELSTIYGLRYCPGANPE